MIERMLQATCLSLSYADGTSTIRAVSDVSLAVACRQFVGVMGPSGSGKSSLLYLLSGLRKPAGGDVCLDGRSYADMTERERVNLRRTQFGFVFQRHFLVEHLTVIENVMASAPRHDKEWLDRARAHLDQMGMGNMTHRFPHELSGGERQRTAICRAMLHRPRVIFADEPTGMLDRKTGLQVMELLRGCQAFGSLIAVTHDRGILAEADTVITMRDGRIVDGEGQAQARAPVGAV